MKTNTTRPRFGTQAWSVDVIDVAGELILFYPFIPRRNCLAPERMTFAGGRTDGTLPRRVSAVFESADHERHTMVYREDTSQ